MALETLDYGFDTDGKITSIADAGGTRAFTYDATQQLTGAGYASRPETYSYDPEGNRTSSHLSTSYVTGVANRLIEDDTTCYAYDANGNLERRIQKLGASCTGAETGYAWDALNRLVRIDNPDGTYAAYRYDAQGRRIEKDVNGSVTKYVYDDDAILVELDGAGMLQARYTHGEEIDQPLAMTRGAASYFYHPDHLGSIRLMTDAAGAVAARYDYDAFGNWESTSYERVANPYGFTARERDAESGLMFYRARYYDPRIGRFISEDPIGFEGEDLNLYRYVYNSPPNLIDPEGRTVLGGLFLVGGTAIATFAAFVIFEGTYSRLKNRRLPSLVSCRSLSLMKNVHVILSGAAVGISALSKLGKEGFGGMGPILVAAVAALIEEIVVYMICP